MPAETNTQSSSPQYFEDSSIYKIKKILKSVDRVLIAFLLILSAVWFFTPEKTWSSLVFVGENIKAISIYLVISVALAAYIKASGADKLVGAAFRANAGKAIAIASLVGALSPFCSCGVVPLIAALLGAGVPLAPVMAFWLASPVIDPEMMILTGAALGPEFATAKTLAAISLGAMGGYSTLLIQQLGGFKAPLKNITVSTCGAGSITREEKPVWKFWKDGERVSAFGKEAKSNAWFLLKWLSIAFLLEAVMLDNINMEQVGEWLATLGAWAIPVASFVGVPSYLNGYAAIPLADMLLKLGLNPGAVLSFMVAGGVTSIPAAIAVQALTKLPVFITYLVLALSGSMIIGFAYATWINLMA